MSSSEALLRAVEVAYGLSPRHDWPELTERNLPALAARRGQSVCELLSAQHTWTSLLPELVSLLTVGETYFMRHPTHFVHLSEVASALLLNAPDRTLRLWSCGCASGEEAYSLAIALHSALGDQGLLRVEIRGSDASAVALSRARAARYGAWSFREAPAWLRARYFQEDGDKHWLVGSKIRDAVKFELAETLSLARTLPSASLDVIFFRNVAIYLRADAIAQTYAELRRVLKPGGLLFVAPADPRPDSRDFRLIDHVSTSVYAAAEARSQDLPRERSVLSPSRHKELRTERTLSRPSTRRGSPTRHGERNGSERSPQRARPETPLPAPNDLPLRAAADLAAARELGDRGKLDAALQTASQLTNDDPHDVHAHVLRGQLELSAARPDKAVESFRRALFLAPDHALARFWYAVSLLEGGHPGAALIQLRTLRSHLVARPTDASLEDGETRAEQLLESAMLMEGALR